MIRSSPPAVVLASVLLPIFVAACGGRDTVASQSAEAYRDAVERGLPMDDGHGGHDGAGEEDGAMAMSPVHDDAAAHQADAEAADHVEDGAAIGAAGHGAHPPGRDDAAHPTGAGAAHGVDHGASDQAVRHASAQHQTTPQRGAAHEAMGHDVAGDTGTTGAARHGGMIGHQPGAQHGAAAGQEAPAQHGATMSPGAAAQQGAMARGEAPGAEHGGLEATVHTAAAHAAIPAGGLWGPVPGAAPAPPSIAPPLPVAPASVNSEAMARLSPESTLMPDRGDTPAEISVIEAQKSAGVSHEGHETPDPAEPQDEHREHPPE